jgi:hypothetical protein
MLCVVFVQQKRPELGTIGYLGIGFKSVFKITDSPHIFSGRFSI